MRGLDVVYLLFNIHDGRGKMFRCFTSQSLKKTRPRSSSHNCVSYDVRASSPVAITELAEWKIPGLIRFSVEQYRKLNSSGEYVITSVTVGLYITSMEQSRRSKSQLSHVCIHYRYLTYRNDFFARVKRKRLV